MDEQTISCVCSLVRSCIVSCNKLRGRQKKKHQNVLSHFREMLLLTVSSFCRIMHATGDKRGPALCLWRDPAEGREPQGQGRYPPSPPTPPPTHTLFVGACAQAHILLFPIAGSRTLHPTKSHNLQASLDHRLLVFLPMLRAR